MSNRYFAIGVSTEWVEIRSSSKPPVKRTSRAEKIIDSFNLQHDQVYDPYWGYTTVRTKRVPAKKKLVIKATTYEGGNVVATLRAEALYRKLRISIKRGLMLELDKEQLAKLKLKETE